MLMPGRKYAADSKYRYGFNGKENDNDVKGEGNQQDYGMRIYDGRLGRFLSVDPIVKSYPELTPYQFASNIPIQCIDLDGLEAYKIVGRSFAPKWSFTNSHFDAIADNRTKFQIADFKKVSARIHILLNVNLDSWMLSKRIETQPTITKGGISFDAKNMTLDADMMGSIGEKNFTIKGNYWAKNGTNFGPGINIKFIIDIKRPDDNTLNISTNIYGNVFPAQETMIFDGKGTGLFLGVSTANGGPLSGVWGNGFKNNLVSNSLKVQTNENGDFLGVYGVDKNGNEIVKNPAAYNKQFSDKKVWNLQDEYDNDTGELKKSESSKFQFDKIYLK